MTAVVGQDRRTTDRVVVAEVLVVDDSRVTRTILRRLLEGAAYRVTEAADGEQALAACRTRRPDVVLLDLDMPVLDGAATLRCLSADPELAGLPVIVLTGQTSANQAAELLDLGAQDYVRKPCGAEELAARVRGVLRRQSDVRHLRRQAEEAERTSSVDALTGAANRLGLARRRVELTTALGSDAVAGVAVIDVDHFKQINDGAGHLVGDAVLRILTRRLADAVSSDDLLVRWGGEEFLVLTVAATLEETEALARRLHHVVGADPIAVGGVPAQPITVSAGCACGPLADLDDVILRADLALYEAKRTGRDRVVSSPGDGRVAAPL